MAQSLCINEKEYLPSTQLAKRFSYTSDYISKLARDEKVLATRVGRQWFIEPESLRLYIQQLEIEKRISKEKLSRQRKIERGQSTQKTKSNTPQAANSLAQALVIMLLGSTVGLLGWSVLASGLTSGDLTRGAALMLASIEDRILVSASFLSTSDTLQRSVASPFLGSEQSRLEESVEIMNQEVGPQFERGGVYTTFPSMSTGTSTEGRVLGEQAVGINFSDEVLVTREGDELYVQPVLRGEVGASHQIVAPGFSELIDE